MVDLAYIVVCVLFFAGCVFFVRLCEHL
jgi:hypothetical protein